MYVALPSAPAMPLKTLDADQTAEGLKDMESEFHTLLEDCLVPEEAIALIGYYGIKKMRTLAKIAVSKDEKSVRQWIEEDLGLKASEGIKAKVVIAKITDAMDCCQRRASAWADAEAAVLEAARRPGYMRAARGSPGTAGRGREQAQGTRSGRWRGGRLFLDSSR